MNKKLVIILLALPFLSGSRKPVAVPRIFDVHLHGSADPSAQLKSLQEAGVYRSAISTSWNLQENYRERNEVSMDFGLMFPCPLGKVPYSLQPCYEDGKDWPAIEWVEQQIREGKVDYFGEILNEYYGISPSDPVMFPYYALAVKYQLPVGVHTGAAGPDHGSPHFNIDMGNPLLLENALAKFPGLRLWIMHGGDHYYAETITIMKKYPGVYADISVLSNPYIVPAERFAKIMHAFLDAGLEDRLMFGSDNGDIGKVIAAVEGLSFLTGKQKEKIYFENAERFFGNSRR